MPIYPIEPFKPTKNTLPFNRTELRRSHDTGFTFAWPVMERYLVKDGVLSGEGRVARLTTPAGETRIFEILERVHAGTLRPEDFAAEHGLLGFTHICEPGYRRGGDPLKWFRQQAKNVFEILNLLHAIEEKNLKTIRDFLEGSPKVWATVSWPKRPVRAAQEYVQSVLNPSLEGIHRQLIVGADGIRSIFKPRALLDVIYWRLADFAEGRDGVGRCQECGTLFIRTDARQLYCPDKTCAVRHRVKTFRERRRGQRK